MKGILQVKNIHYISNFLVLSSFLKFFIKEYLLFIYANTSFRFQNERANNYLS